MSKPIPEQQKRFNDFKTELTALSLKYDVYIESYFNLVLLELDKELQSNYDIYFDEDLQKYV